VGSLIDKYEDVICHNCRREKISPDDLPLQPFLKIWGVRPPAKKEDKDKGQLIVTLGFGKEPNASHMCASIKFRTYDRLYKCILEAMS
jgi:hypothetical protein